MSARVPGLGAIVLAGGRSTRMGRDKASLDFDGEPLLARVLRALGGVCEEVVVVARPGQALPPAPPLPEPLRLLHVQDAVEGRGPLAGLAAGLAVLRSPRAFASSCDVPFLQPSFVRAVDAALGERDIAIPFVEGRHHPLAAVYRRERVAPVAEDLLAADRLRPVFLLERLSHVEVGRERLIPADAALASLHNCNTPEDLEWALTVRRERLVRVELFGIAALRAGASEVEVEGRTLSQALTDLERRVPALAGEVLRDGTLAEHWIASVDGWRFTADGDAPLRPPARVLLLSSLSGG